VLPNQRVVRISMEKGELCIARKVLLSIVHREAREAPGVVELGGFSIWKRIARFFGLPLGMRGVRVDLGEGEIGVVLTLVVRAGVDIPELAEHLRRRITEVVRASTGLHVSCVDVHVASIRDELPPRTQSIEDPAAEAARRFWFDGASTTRRKAADFQSD
jgi:uncharacterized alkaline shock family protein YloU